MKKVYKLSLTLLAIICSSLFMQGNTIDTYADDSITLTIDTSNISLNLATTSSSGKFAESTPANISVSTTSTSGYTLSIASSTGSTDLTNTTDNTSKLTSISNNLTNTDFSSSSNTQYNNQWGYKPSQYVTMVGNTPTIHPNTGTNAVFKPLPNQSGEILAITDEANQQGTSDTYTISMGARVNSDTKTGSYRSEPFIIMAVSNKGVVECDGTKLCVQFDGNGLTFPETDAQAERFVNNVNYDSSTTIISDTKYSHTPNISDDGTYSGNTYTSNMDTTDTVTIDGAASLNVTIYYDTESASYDWVSVYQSPFDISNANDATVSNTTGNLSGKLGGRKTNRTTNYTTWYTQTYAVTGDTVKFHFRSDSSDNYYGYYAIITGTGTVRDRTVTSGEYAIPTGTNPLFHGWSSTATTPGRGLPSDVEYADEAAIKSNMPGDNTETKTLYAVWQQSYPITFTMDNNTSSIAVLDANGTTIGTITSSGQSLTLLGGDTYTLKPTYVTGYTTDVISKTSGAGVISGDVRQRQFTVGAGSATINVTSRQMLPMQNYSCSNLANIGDTDMVYDTRDNQAYTIGKLADGNCWLLDNLALDLVAKKSVLTQDNTHASDTTLNYLKNGGGSTSDKYATAAVSNWTSSYSYSAPRVNLTNKDVIPSDATSQAGQYKVGGYYNYCAASAGSYCYGSGTSAGTSSGNATEDICPKGWRMPTGDDTGEYQALYNNSRYNTYASYRSALHLPLPGYFYSGSAKYQGSNGDWWSSTRSGNDGMYRLSVGTSGIYPVSSYTRDLGVSVRCVLGSQSLVRDTVSGPCLMPSSPRFSPPGIQFWRRAARPQKKNLCLAKQG